MLLFRRNVDLDTAGILRRGRASRGFGAKVRGETTLAMLPNVVCSAWRHTSAQACGEHVA